MLFLLNFPVSETIINTLIFILIAGECTPDQIKTSRD